MKYFKSLIYLLTTSVLLLTSCDQYDDQVVAEPGGYDQEALLDNTFVAETAMDNYTIEEAQADESVAVVDITTALTPTDANAIVSYELEVATDEDFTDATSIDFTLSGTTISVKNSDLNTLILNLTESEDEASIYFRLYAYISNSGLKTMQMASSTSAMMIAVTPYSVLKPYTEFDAVYPYYIVGLDGIWNNSVAGLGSSLIPLGLVSGDAYNSDGAGTFVYTGYFSSSAGFKLIGVVGGWDEQWGSSDGALTPVHNDGGSQNFKVPSDGYYTITLNSITNEMSIEAADVTPTSYTSMGLIGDINGWGGDVAMSANTSAGDHIWYVTYTFDNASGEVKIRANGGWDVNWGASEFPMGIGTAGGSNIPYTSGTYTLIFNDIDGCYYFYAN